MNNDKEQPSPYPPAWTFLIAPVIVAVIVMLALSGCADFYFMYIYPITHGHALP